MDALGFPVVGDGGHQLAGAAEPVERRAQAGEVVHQRLEDPAGADADDDLATKLLAAGASLHHINRYLGHVSERMTEHSAIKSRAVGDR